MRIKVKNQKKQIETYRYFAGESFPDLVSNVTGIMLDYSEEVKDSKVRMSVFIVHPEPNKLGFECYLGDIKICTVFRYEAQDTDGFRNLSWIVWHNDLDGVCFEEIYESEIGFSDCVETHEDEETFINRELVNCN